MANESVLNAQVALAEMKTNPVLRDWQERNHDFWKDILTKLPPNPLEVSDFQPRQGFPGTILEIMGAGFGDVNTPIQVTVGGATAMVLERTPVWLRVLTDTATKPGKVSVTVGANSAVEPTLGLVTQVAGHHRNN